MAITMLRKKPAGEIKELDEKAVDDFLDSASHVKKESVSKKKKQITLTISESLLHSVDEAAHERFNPLMPFLLAARTISGGLLSSSTQ